MEKWEKNTQFGHFSETSTGTIEVLPVQLKFCLNDKQTGFSN